MRIWSVDRRLAAWGRAGSDPRRPKPPRSQTGRKRRAVTEWPDSSAGVVTNSPRRDGTDALAGRIREGGEAQGLQAGGGLQILEVGEPPSACTLCTSSFILHVQPRKTRHGQLQCWLASWAPASKRLLRALGPLSGTLRISHRGRSKSDSLGREGDSGCEWRSQSLEGELHTRAPD